MHQCRCPKCDKLSVCWDARSGSFACEWNECGFHFSVPERSPILQDLHTYTKDTIRTLYAHGKYDQITDFFDWICRFCLDKGYNAIDPPIDYFQMGRLKQFQVCDEGTEEGKTIPLINRTQPGYKNLKVISVLHDLIISYGCDGLVSLDGECGCKLDNLIPCNSDFSQCIFGYVGPDNDGNDDFTVYVRKNHRDEAVLEAKNLKRSNNDD